MEDMIVIRCAGEDDRAAIARLAELDSRDPPEGRLLLALVDGELQAALELEGGELVANPFKPTLALAAILRLRAEQEQAWGDENRAEGGLRKPLRWLRAQAEGVRA